ncbi:MAG: F0F1 ATP synthase subunit delta [gamma proteobacterium symbiont of Ctena orbiculata]|nr:MAG: F0F1 ATP synthase subunit delta [gamma proteobacterium symbiont of Ctena orbiculata]PVV21604.1 MAG: F0F1 ATP synthase subunit delta [gamma proteobacterium symbiont of Ctena orbiculata]PVV24144.1 MAG: F0F1 ATP synthase subunit delta [gamma proteobacterium symbiont of Ctena orbiculata]
MAGEATTIARPYAEAVFARAEESGKLDIWSDMLSFLTSVVESEEMAPIVGNPLVEQEALVSLLLEIVGDKVDQEGGNLIKVLVENGRLSVLPEIDALFEELKADKQRISKVHVTSAFTLDTAQEKLIADALKAKLGRDVTITSELDAELIGGVHIRAGDMVIDGSVRGQLQQLANELGI